MSSKYIEIYEKLKKDIVQGIYKTGEKLKSKRVLAEEEGVSVITAEHAYQLLLEEGYIETRMRSGYYVVYSEGDFFPGEPEDTASSSLSGEKDITGTFPETGWMAAEGFSERRIGTGDRCPETKKAAGETLSEALYARTARKVLTNHTKELMERSPAFGVHRLKNAIREYLRRSRHIEVLPEQIVIGSGAEYLYGLIVRTLGRELCYGVEYPGYQRIEEVYLADGASVEELPLGKDGIDSKALWKSRADVLHITPFRSFPTGVTATPAKKAEYLKWSIDRKTILIEDDVESEFTPLHKAEDTIFSLDGGGRVIYVNSFTKTIGPSVRVAYMLIPVNMLSRVEEKVGFYSCPVPVLEQLIVAELIEGGEFERHINRVRRKNRMMKNGRESL